mmetsp:Transcript_249/g.559  ORF Transcript_249/g.559 Transcript_249/m.559 type:complete len:93 (-) Transcript_249:1359-1637(-)
MRLNIAGANTFTLSLNVVKGLLPVLLPLLSSFADEIELASMKDFNVNTMLTKPPHTVVLTITSDFHPFLIVPQTETGLYPVTQLTLQANTIT